MNRSIVIWILSGLVLVAALAGIAFLAFNAGAAYGAQSEFQLPAHDPEALVLPYYAYGLHPYGYHRIGCFGLLIPLLLLFLVFGAFRRLTWGPRRTFMRPGAWGGCWNEDLPPMFNEWHRRAHNAPQESKPTSNEEQN